jgi:hypothetical protein
MRRPYKKDIVRLAGLDFIKYSQVAEVGGLSIAGLQANRGDEKNYRRSFLVNHAFRNCKVHLNQESFMLVVLHGVPLNCNTWYENTGAWEPGYHIDIKYFGQVQAAAKRRTPENNEAYCNELHAEMEMTVILTKYSAERPSTARKPTVRHCNPGYFVCSQDS